MRAAVQGEFPSLREAVRFLAISFETPEALRAQSRRLHEAFFEVCSDPDRRLYAAFGLPRLATRDLLGRRTLLFYLGKALRGRWQRRVGSDVHQMGGDFILDREGRLRFAFRSQEPADRPDARWLIRELARWARPGVGQA